MQRAASILSSLRMPEGCVRRDRMVCKAWNPAVGKRIAARTRAVYFRQGALVVEVADPVWQTQLGSLQTAILRNLEKVLGQPWVESIEFRVRIPRRLPQAVKPGSAAPVDDPSPQRRLELEAAHDDAEGIADPVLRRLYRASRKRQSA